MTEDLLRPSFAPVDYPFPLRRAVRAGRLIAVSGQFGQSDFRLVPGGLDGQVRQALGNIRSALDQHSTTMRDVVKTTVYLADIDDFHQMNRIYLEFFDMDRLPARSTAGVALPFGALVEIEAWACRPMTVGIARRHLQGTVRRARQRFSSSRATS